MGRYYSLNGKARCYKSVSVGTYRTVKPQRQLIRGTEDSRNVNQGELLCRARLLASASVLELCENLIGGKICKIYA